MTRFLAPILILASASVFSSAPAPAAELLSDNDKVRIIESVLERELQTQATIPDFASIRRVSDDNIEFTEPSRLTKHGFTLVASSELSESKRYHVVEYLLFKRIESREGRAVIQLSRVTEGRPCFGAAFSTDRTYTYEARQTDSGWVAELIRRPTPGNRQQERDQRAFARVP